MPKLKIPVVELPAADPAYVTYEAAVAEPFVSPEYVYLLRVVDPWQTFTHPNAKIPTVEDPDAD